MSDFGYTNSDADYSAVVAWRTAALADGWTLENVYEIEPAQSYGKIAKEGFTGHVCARVTTEMQAIYPHHRSKWKYEAQIHLWGPDGLAIKSPDVYNWNVIIGNSHTCSACGAVVVKTFRYGFAGRCCEACLPAMRAQHEQPGWCD